jgi:septal ring factor EnvC (AmiA/AmiB activator)
MPLAIVTATALSQLVNAATLEPAAESVAAGPTATGTAPRQGPEAVTVAALLEQIMAPLSAAVEASRQETALAEARENELDELANQLAEITEALAQERARSASLEQSLRTHDQQHAAIRAKFEELETLLSSG